MSITDKQGTFAAPPLRAAAAASSGGGGGGGGAAPCETKQPPWSDYFAGLEDKKSPLFKEFTKTLWKGFNCKILFQNLSIPTPDSERADQNVGENAHLRLPEYARGHRWAHLPVSSF